MDKMKDYDADWDIGDYILWLHNQGCCDCVERCPYCEKDINKDINKEVNIDEKRDIDELLINNIQLEVIKEEVRRDKIAKKKIKELFTKKPLTTEDIINEELTPKQKRDKEFEYAKSLLNLTQEDLDNYLDKK